jgi:hypothetical protein
MFCTSVESGLNSALMPSMNKSGLSITIWSPLYPILHCFSPSFHVLLPIDIATAGKSRGTRRRQSQTVQHAASGL